MLGEVDAGYVYVSDGGRAAEQRSSRSRSRSEFNIVADYPIATARQPPNPTLAESFVNYVLSPAGQKTLGKYGFSPA